MAKIYVLHENNDWVIPLRKAFAERNLPYAEWYLDQWAVDLSGLPPHGVFYNRMSASSHTRNHRYAAELTAAAPGLARTARAARRQRQPRARPRDQQGASIRRSRSRRHSHPGHCSCRRQGTARRGRPAGLRWWSLDPQAEPRRQRPRRAAVPQCGRARRLPPGVGLRPAGGWPSSVAAICPRGQCH